MKTILILTLITIMLIGCTKQNPTEPEAVITTYPCTGLVVYGNGVSNRCTGYCDKGMYWGICTGRTKIKGALCKETTRHLHQGC